MAHGTLIVGASPQCHVASISPGPGKGGWDVVHNSQLPTSNLLMRHKAKSAVARALSIRGLFQHRADGQTEEREGGQDPFSHATSKQASKQACTCSKPTLPAVVCR